MLLLNIFLLITMKIHHSFKGNWYFIQLGQVNGQIQHTIFHYLDIANICSSISLNAITNELLMQPTFYITTILILLIHSRLSYCIVGATLTMCS